MNKTRALLVAIEPYVTQGSRLPFTVNFSPSLVGIVADHHAMGYRIVGVLASDSFGLETDSDVNQLGMAVCRAIASNTGVEPHALTVLDSTTDPRPLWEAARRFDLDLRNSMLLTEGGIHAGIARTAGVGRIISLGEVQSLYVAA